MALPHLDCIRAQTAYMLKLNTDNRYNSGSALGLAPKHSHKHH